MKPLGDVHKETLDVKSMVTSKVTNYCVIACQKILHVFSAKRDDSGTYRCEAKSHEVAKNDTEIEFIVNYPPENVKLMLTRSGKSATIRCTAEARPSASFKIFLNQTKIVAQTEQILITPEVKKNHVGYYTCFARNFLGNESSDREYLSPEDKASSNNTSRVTEWYIVVLLLVSGIIIGILLSYIVSCSRRKFRSRKPHSNPEPSTTEADTTDYQELDLSQTNTEDNYQSLRVNAAINEEESTYNELNTTKDVENNYTNL
ncbi:igLON family member 5 [Paramuricea clavata]|uniref:IgLON family member 5 n=2 Tax=Paramuricea clavata TaxID=317549 RepID=A0A6S7G346_PARCT|nr:igLON family member 5 [Paramuricea clavata]